MRAPETLRQKGLMPAPKSSPRKRSSTRRRRISPSSARSSPAAARAAPATTCRSSGACAQRTMLLYPLSRSTVLLPSQPLLALLAPSRCGTSRPTSRWSRRRGALSPRPRRSAAHCASGGGRPRWPRRSRAPGLRRKTTAPPSGPRRLCRTGTTLATSTCHLHLLRLCRRGRRFRARLLSLPPRRPLSRIVACRGTSLAARSRPSTRNTSSATTPSRSCTT
mmetsp:Transcript_23026/g.78749  ORF Transcript_23026/g.78749 Transcript_23026/m.78749 type:complete len:221 (-) Transcript_23026:1163-1825(-)